MEKIYFSWIFLFSMIIFSSSKRAGNAGFFWHVTDIHVDQNYSRNGDPHNLCHKENTLYSDNGLYGNFLCDSPEYLVNVTFKAMKKIKPDPDFIIWTGDNLPHTTAFDPDWNVIYDVLYNVTILFDENFPGIPVFPCIGNHDTFPPNVLLPNKTSFSIYQDILSKGGWNKYIDPDARATFIKGGYFSQILRSGLRIISLNTILWYTPNYLTIKMTDPADQFKWLEETLSNSSKASEKVYIIGHVPPGFYNRAMPGKLSTSTYHVQYIDAYLRILRKYAPVISGQMFGHLHMDMFQIFSLESGDFVSSSVLASSVTPWHFESKYNVSLPVNPSVRLMHYDRNNFLLTDYNQFYLNLTKANKMAEVKASENLYELLYTFTKAYNVPDVSTDSLVKVYENIKKNETLFDIFFKFSTAGKESALCDTSCKVAQLCAISSINVGDYNMCMKGHSFLNFLCHDIIIHQSYSNMFAYIFAIIVCCISIFLLLFICQKHRQSRGDMYTKLLNDI